MSRAPSMFSLRKPAQWTPGKNFINEIVDVTVIILSIIIVNLDLKPPHCQKNLKEHKVNNNNKIILRRRQERCLINNNNNNKNTKLIKARRRTTTRSVSRTRRSPSQWKVHYQSPSWLGSPCQASHSRSAGASFSWQPHLNQPHFCFYEKI